MFLRGSVPAALLALSVPCWAADEGVVDPQGPVASAERTILIDSLGIMLAIVIPVIIATLAVAWWFRASNHRAVHLPDWEYSGRIELVVWSIPAMTILLLGGLGWVGAHDLDPPRPIGPGKPLVVDVVSLDWKWLFIYPEQGVASAGRLVIPAGRPVEFRITSSGVMNSFFVPQLGSQIYAMAGMVTRVNLQADHAGSFAGLSAQFSGDHFSDMRFAADAMQAAQFDEWVDRVKRGSPTRLDAAAYDDLAKPDVLARPVTYGMVAPDLFQHVLSTAVRGEMSHPDKEQP